MFSLHSSKIFIKFFFQERTLRFRSGKDIPTSELKWHPSFPRGSGEIMAYTTNDITNANHGVWNGYSGNLHGVICEKDL